MVAAESWARLRRALLHIARRYCVTQADAEDVVQLVLERLLTYRTRLALPETQPSGGYLRQMCLNTVRSAHRSQVRQWKRESEWAEMLQAVDTPEDALMERTNGAQLLAALSAVAAAVPSNVAEAFRLCDVEGLSAPKAALLLGVPEGTVRTWLRRFRAGLDEALRAGEAVPT